jgi:hypothetical protein
MHQSLIRAKQLSRHMQHALMLTGIIIIGITIWVAGYAISDPSWVNALLKSKYGNFGPDTLSLGQTLSLVSLFIVQIVLLLVALQALWRAFGAIALSDGISLETAQWLRRSGFWFGIATITMILSHPLNSIIASIGAGAGHQFINVSFESQYLLTFLLSAVLLVLGHVLVLAADIAEDNRQII